LHPCLCSTWVLRSATSLDFQQHIKRGSFLPEIKQLSEYHTVHRTFVSLILQNRWSSSDVAPMEFEYDQMCEYRTDRRVLPPYFPADTLRQTKSRESSPELVPARKILIPQLLS
jgi:hypothetical protein